ncbi:MAG: hypothetical protein LW698_16270 [Planctomycetaceae bacterium]|nr:hypothetical protein [Planctomycetaceae bacterium]
MRHTRFVNAVRLLTLAAGIVVQAGCTSALSTAYLRDALWDMSEHAAESAAEVPAAAGAATSAPGDRVADDVAVDRADAERRQAAIEEAVERLARIGTLNAAAQAALVETLQATQQEDWPIVIEAFSATLADEPAAAAERRAASESEPMPEPHVVAKAPTESAPGEAAAPPAAALAAVVAPEPPAGPAASLPPGAPPAPATPPDPPAAVARPPLAVRNACFASRVRGWGNVERFPADRFQPGQEVIVYFELDGLSAAESAAGFRTAIDANLRLVDGEGREVHAWNFEPITETCPARRHDYFARYVVRLPESAAGACRVELAVRDAIAGGSATATLPCTVE